MRALQALGYDLDEDEAVAFHVHGIDAAFAEEMERLGFRDLDPHDLIALRIHGIDAAFMDEMKALGFPSLSPEHAIALQIHDIDARFMQEMRNLGMTDLTPVRLVAMRLLELDRAYLDALRGQPYHPELFRERLETLGHFGYGRTGRSSYDDEFVAAMRAITFELTQR